ncbi:MAG: hypothetical protein QHH80_09510, partial [Anaerolineae bacterium]|nr:hypothetical protein [Anaerolineae bacterium]
MGWLELTQEVDEESAEAVVELFNRYCRGSAVVEQQVGTEDGGEPLPPGLGEGGQQGGVVVHLLEGARGDDDETIPE